MTDRFILFVFIFVFPKLKLSTHDSRPLSAEEQSRSVRLTVTQSDFNPWTWIWDSEQSPEPRTTIYEPTTNFFTVNDIPVEDMDLPVTADGVMSFQIQLSDSIATLDIEV